MPRDAQFAGLVKDARLDLSALFVCGARDNLVRDFVSIGLDLYLATFPCSNCGLLSANVKFLFFVCQSRRSVVTCWDFNI